MINQKQTLSVLIKMRYYRDAQYQPILENALQYFQTTFILCK